MIVYVSGASDRKRNAPPVSVSARSVCDGDAATTSAPTTGVLVAWSTMRPTTVPVVPAIDGAATSVMDRTDAATIAAMARK